MGSISRAAGPGPKATGWLVRSVSAAGQLEAVCARWLVRSVSAHVWRGVARPQEIIRWVSEAGRLAAAWAGRLLESVLSLVGAALWLW